MQQIDLAAIANQSFSIRLEDDFYDITIRLAVNVMVMDVIRNNTLILSSQRLVPDGLVIPYEYLEDSQGNFLFLTESGDYPYYTQFGITQRLLYLTSAEMETARNGT